LRYRGAVTRGRVARGSKSERTAVLLQTETGDFLLRRRDGHPLRDPELDALVGKTIECDAEAHDNLLIMSSWRVLD
jgi:hypothetical protein